jgi:hypothetical protein
MMIEQVIIVFGEVQMLDWLFLKSTPKPKIQNIEDLLSRANSRWGSEYRKNIIGCTEQEIAQVEERFGTLPIVYKDILMAIGKRIKHPDPEIEKSMDARRDHDFYLEEVLDLTVDMTMPIPEDEPDELMLPKENIFFIFHVFSGNVYFVVTNKGDIDAPVFVEDWKDSGMREEYIFKKAYDSIWDWIDDYIG